MKRLLILIFAPTFVWSQALTELSVEKIMRDPKWIGVSPSTIFWREDSKQVYFQSNPEKNQGDSLYSISITDSSPVKVNHAIPKQLSSFVQYNRSRSKQIFEENGDPFLLDIPSNKSTHVTNS